MIIVSFASSVLGFFGMSIHFILSIRMTLTLRFAKQYPVLTGAKERVMYTETRCVKFVPRKYREPFGQTDYPGVYVNMSFALPPSQDDYWSALN